MDVLNILIGVSLILVSIIISIIQIREGVFKKKGGATIGDVKLTIAGLFSILGGLCLLISAFQYKWIKQILASAGLWPSQSCDIILEEVFEFFVGEHLVDELEAGQSVFVLKLLDMPELFDGGFVLGDDFSWDAPVIGQYPARWAC